MGAGEKGDVKRHPKVRVLTALLGEVTAERHFSWHAESEIHKGLCIKHNINLCARRQTLT